MTAEPRRISYTLVADGSRDRALLPNIIQWIIQGMDEYDMQINSQLADPPSGCLSERLKYAIAVFPCDILFVHRDAEGQPREARTREIAEAVREAGITEDSVPVVPVRMTEAWLLISESAIRRAAGNPNGSSTLAMPRIRELEAIPNPKEMLHSLLTTAFEKSGRRQKGFHQDMNMHVRRVPDFIEDYSPLRCLPAFRAFEQDTQSAIRRVIGQ